MYIPSGVVPTREQIEKLRVHTDQLAKEKVSRTVSVILLTPLFLNEIVYRSVPMSFCVVLLVHSGIRISYQVVLAPNSQSMCHFYCPNPK